MRDQKVQTISKSKTILDYIILEMIKIADLLRE